MPLQRYVATRDAEAGDRRQPHLLALGVDLRDAARAGARAARDGGAGRLRGRLREPAPPPAARRRPARRSAARGDADRRCRCPAPARRASAATAAPKCCRPSDGEAPAPGAGEVRIRQRAIGVNFIDVYLRRGWIPALLPLPGVPGMEAAGTRDRCRRRTSAACCPATAWPTSAPCPAPIAACAACRPTGWCACLPTIEDDIAAALLLKGITADYLLRDLGRVRRRHAAAGARGGRRRRPAGVLLGAPPRRHGDRHGVERREGAGRARARLRACRSSRATTRFADAVQRACGGADVVIDGLGRCGARRELRGAGPPRPLDQPRPGQRRRCSRSPPDALVQKSLTFSRPVVFDYVATPAQLAERAARVWDALADGTLARRRSSATRWTPPRRRTRGSNRAPAIGALVAASLTPKEIQVIVGMNHFTVIAEDEAKTLDFYLGCSACKVGHRPDLGFPRRLALRRPGRRRCCMSTSTVRCRRSAPA